MTQSFLFKVITEQYFNRSCTLEADVKLLKLGWPRIQAQMHLTCHFITGAHYLAATQEMC